MNVNDQVAQFCDNPTGYFNRCSTQLQSQPKESYEQLQLAGLQLRFSQLRDTIPMLKKLADRENVAAITTLDDIVPLLFDHAMYKSYPTSLLHNNRFAQLTKWLDKLTSVDLSVADVSQCKSVDEWLAKLDEDTGVLVCHTSGTSGTFSFLPRSRTEWRRWLETYPVTEFQVFGEKVEPLETPLNVDVVYPYFRYGSLSHVLMNETVAEVISGGEDKLHCVYPGRLSADVMLLAARIHAAKAKGELDKLAIAPELLARRDEFMAMQKDLPERVSEFFDDVSQKLKGKQVFVQIATPTLLRLAQAGLAKGESHLFSPNSVIITGGGGKGIVLPDDWQDTVKEYWGVDNINLGFGMSEMNALFPQCEHNRYHVMPWVVPFVLDPDTSEALPREGEKTGRFAFYDLSADSRWGGFITGDEVTVDWETPCACGRTTPHMSTKIQRFSEKTGEEDKISCAASPDAYEEAMDFLNDFEA